VEFLKVKSAVCVIVISSLHYTWIFR